MSSLFVVMSVGVAHADPDFTLGEAEARAGDTVHFSITGANGPVTYELEIGHHDVLEDGVGAGSIVTGEFTLPQLGDSDKSITVKAEIRERGDRTTAKSKLHYLGPALPVLRPTNPVSAPGPAPQPPAPEPSAVLPSAVLPPEPAHTTQGATAPASRIPAVRRRTRSGGKQAQVKARGHTPRSSSSGGRKTDRNSPRKRTRAKKPAPRTAPLFDGVPEPGAGNNGRSREDGYASRNAAAQPAARLTGTHSASHGGGALTAAVLVPGLMGAAALVLTGTTLHRRRRLR